MINPPTTAWIAVDWGTSHLRAWAMDDNDQVIAKAANDQGMGVLANKESDSQAPPFEGVLLSLISRWLPPHQITSILICGMAGARQGWQEAPYLSLPCAPPNRVQALKVTTIDSRLEVRILPGVAQASPADVMRGEETQIKGYLATRPAFDGILCLPGTHSKWVWVNADGLIEHFATFMTGEVFDLLANQSLLRHTIASEGWDDNAFAAAVRDGLDRPQALTNELFGLRAQGLLDNTLLPVQARARLSGLLIGMELAAIKPTPSQGIPAQEIIIIGADDLAKTYAQALVIAGYSCQHIDGSQMTLTGLITARKSVTSP